ncbi:MAG TPA: outer membrane protein [Pseudolabrys sp.]|nr:outer membrane protein [Pseudolabrys sp.]
MKRSLLLGAAVGALSVAAPAMAADMPIKAPKVPVALPYSWTGFYAGANIGYSWGRADTDFAASNLVPFGISGFSGTQHVDGVIGGGQIGYDWQYNNQWVFGLEADFQGSGEKDSDPRAPLSFGVDLGETTVTFALNQTLETKIKWFGTVRGRFGYLVTPTVLLYGTGGFAYGRIEATSTQTLSTSLGTSVSSIVDATKTKFGWTAGAGVEGAIPNTPDWTWKVEYLYIDFGHLGVAGSDTVLGTYSWSTHVTDHIARVGFNYRFH